MSRHRSTNAGPVAGVLLILAVLFVTAACGAVGAAEPSPSVVSPEPSVPVAQPSAAPSMTPDDGAIVLDVADQHVVRARVSDPGDVVRGAASGHAGDGMSVRWGDVEVVNLDEDTLRVTWVGLPLAADVDVAVYREGEGTVIEITQPGPPANSDAIGFDRVLVLDLTVPVRAEDVTASVAEQG